MIKTQQINIKIRNDEAVSAVITTPDQPNTNSNTGLIFAHGAANDKDHPLIVAVSEGLAAHGFATLRFNFLYKEKGKKAPDSQPVLVNTWLQVYEYFKSQSDYNLSDVIGVGKSMGGRIASQMAADGQMELSRLIFLGYPLHAPGKKDKLRDAHLYKIRTPMLFFTGTRDAFCDLDKLNGVLKKLKCQWALDIIQGGDHSFNLLKSDMQTANDIHRQVIRKSLDWLCG